MDPMGPMSPWPQGERPHTRVGQLPLRGNPCSGIWLEFLAESDFVASVKASDLDSFPSVIKQTLPYTLGSIGFHIFIIILQRGVVVVHRKASSITIITWSVLLSQSISANPQSHDACTHGLFTTLVCMSVAVSCVSIAFYRFQVVAPV